VLFGAIGDYFSDRVPLQIGQFESGIEMDDNLTKFVLEGGGGGSYEESYQNALYFFAHRTSCDCLEKRGKKGYLFVVGDEHAYRKTPATQLRDVLGDLPDAEAAKLADKGATEPLAKANKQTPRQPRRRRDCPGLSAEVQCVLHDPTRYPALR
jgi:hypothetical protein